MKIRKFCLIKRLINYKNTIINFGKNGENNLVYDLRFFSLSFDNPASTGRCYK